VDRDDSFKGAIGDAVPLEDTSRKLVLDGRRPEFIPDIEALAAHLCCIAAARCAPTMRNRRNS